MADLTNMRQDEWLEADGLGGFASGTVSGTRTRRYHALLLTATKPPAGRLVLVNGFDASVTTSTGTYALSSQLYPSEIVHPDGARRIAEFRSDPWPQWNFSLEDGTKVQQEIFVLHGASIVCLSWRLLNVVPKANLTLRPFFSGRDYHSMHHENPAFQFRPNILDRRLLWYPYTGLPGIISLHNGEYLHRPDWYRNFVYEQERARGLDFTEDLASPGTFYWDLRKGEAILIFAAAGFDHNQLPPDQSAEQLALQFRSNERRRRAAFATPLDRSADAYLVKRGGGKTIVAGYPWFTDWGRDTFISLGGLCLATGRVDDARDILLEWSGVVSEGMLPNRFPDQGDQPEYNSVDASLWYIIAVYGFLQATKLTSGTVSRWQKESLQKAIEAILTGYSQGTRCGIRMDRDGLLAAGAPGVQLTWMDAKIGDWVVTPRIGKPVEIQALWLNALGIGSQFSERWKEAFALGADSFRARFWNEQGGALYDVVDVDHQSGKVDASFRPNQIFAVGGLPLALIEGERAGRIVEAVTRRLWTPMGLRSLAPEEPGYAPKYDGGVNDRDGVYHQGTVWPWLIGAFVEAWVRVHGGSDKVKREARARFVAPFMEHLNTAGLGHISEIADANRPHTPRGCPFQAWSLAELLRLDRAVLGVAGTGEYPQRAARS
jgi:predicted glycogen debranching enzyme